MSTPKAWRAKRGSTPYTCRAKAIGRTVRRLGREYAVESCATPAKSAPARGQFWIVPLAAGRAHAVPRPAISRALRRPERGLPACPPWLAECRRGRWAPGYEGEVVDFGTSDFSSPLPAGYAPVVLPAFSGALPDDETGTQFSVYGHGGHTGFDVLWALWRAVKVGSPEAFDLWAMAVREGVPLPPAQEVVSDVATLRDPILQALADTDFPRRQVGWYLSKIEADSGAVGQAERDFVMGRKRRTLTTDESRRLSTSLRRRGERNRAIRDLGARWNPSPTAAQQAWFRAIEHHARTLSWQDFVLEYVAHKTLSASERAYVGGMQVRRAGRGWTWGDVIAGQYRPSFAPTDASTAYGYLYRTPLAYFAREGDDARAEILTPRGNPSPLTVPADVLARFARGLALYEAGHAGAGLRPLTVREAREIVRTGTVTRDKLTRWAAWCARHGASPAEARARQSATSPASVAWELWGGTAGCRWAKGRRGAIGNPAIIELDAAARRAHEQRRDTPGTREYERLQRIHANQPRWETLEGQPILRVPGRPFAALPASGRQNAATFVVFDLGTRRVVARIKRDEVTGWLVREALRDNPSHEAGYQAMRLEDAKVHRQLDAMTRECSALTRAVRHGLPAGKRGGSK